MGNEPNNTTDVIEVQLTQEEQNLANLMGFPQVQPTTPEAVNFDDNFFQAQGIKKEDFSKAIKAFGYEDPTELKRALDGGKIAISELDKYRNAPPKPLEYANDEVAHLDTLYRSGASDEEISRFLHLQRIQPDKLSALEAVKLHIQMEYPEMDNDMVQAQIIDTYGTMVEADMTHLAKSKLVMAAKAAKEFLAKSKKDAKKHTNQQSAQTKAYLEQRKKWTMFNLTFLANQKEFLVQLTMPKSDKPYSTVRIPLEDKVKVMIADSMTDYALKSNLKMDNTGASALMEYYDGICHFLFRKEIREQTIAHTADEKLRQVHNIQSPLKNNEPVILKEDAEKANKEFIHSQFNQKR